MTFFPSPLKYQTHVVLENKEVEESFHQPLHIRVYFKLVQ